MELRGGGGRRYRASGQSRAARRPGGAGIHLARGVDVECKVLLDDPLIVRDRGFGRRILHPHVQTAARLENQRRCRSITEYSLRVFRLVRERATCRRATSARSCGYGGEGAICAQIDSYARRSANNGTQRVVVRISVVAQHARGGNPHERRGRAGVAIGIRSRCVRGVGGGGCVQRHRRAIGRGAGRRSPTGAITKGIGARSGRDIRKRSVGI